MTATKPVESATRTISPLRHKLHELRSAKHCRRRDSFCPHHLSLWCSPDNMPASHAGDHRSEAGQGRQFHCPQSILSDALLWYGSQLGGTPGGGSSLASVRKHRSRASAQASIISPLCPGQHWGLRPAFALRAMAGRPFTPPCSSLWISFVKKSCRGSTGGGLQFEYYSGEWLRGNSRPRRSRVYESRRRGM